MRPPGSGEMDSNQEPAPRSIHPSEVVQKLVPQFADVLLHHSIRRTKTEAAIARRRNVQGHGGGA
jgi:hypothetical protein